MKELLFDLLKYYALIGLVCAFCAAAWISFLSVKADLILNRGNTVKVKDGPTFTPSSDRGRMADYFIICRGFGIMMMTFFLWPFMLFILATCPKWWDMVEEVKAGQPAD